MECLQQVGDQTYVDSADATRSCESCFQSEVEQSLVNRPGSILTIVDGLVVVTVGPSVEHSSPGTCWSRVGSSQWQTLLGGAFMLILRRGNAKVIVSRPSPSIELCLQLVN